MSHGVDGHTSPPTIDAELARVVAERMQMLATPSRVQILGHLKQGPCSVGALADAVGMEASAVSHQLRSLRHLGLVVALGYKLGDPLIGLAVTLIICASPGNPSRPSKPTPDSQRSVPTSTQATPDPATTRRTLPATSAV